MPCGCVEVCNCLITDTATISVAGAGTAVSPYQLSVILDDEGGLEAGVDGIAIMLDPASTAPVSLGPDGLLIDCCAASVTDSATIDFSIIAGAITGDVIVDPNDGLQNNAAGVGIKVDPASTATVTTSAAGLRVDAVASAPSPPDEVVFLATDTFDKADYPGLRGIKVSGVGGGGGGAGATADQTMGGGGAAGGASELYIPAASLAASENVVIGAGGLAAAVGGTTTFGTVPFITCTGGAGGTVNGGAVTAGGTGTGGDLNITGGSGGAGGTNANSSYGGSGTPGLGFGAGRPTATAGSNGATGSGFGSGGTGGHRNTVTTRNGGTGAPGAVKVELFF